MSVQSVEYAQYVDSLGVLNARYQNHLDSYNSDILSVYNINPTGVDGVVLEGLLKDFKKLLRTYKKCEQWQYGFNQHMCGNNGGSSGVDEQCIWCRAQTSEDELGKIISSLSMLHQQQQQQPQQSTTPTNTNTNTTANNTMDTHNNNARLTLSNAQNISPNTTRASITTIDNNVKKMKVSHSSQDYSNNTVHMNHQQLQTNSSNNSKTSPTALSDESDQLLRSERSKHEDQCIRHNQLQQKCNATELELQHCKLKLVEVQDKQSQVQHTLRQSEQQHVHELSRKEQEVTQRILALEQKMDEERKQNSNYRTQAMQLDAENASLKQQLQELASGASLVNNSEFTTASSRLGGKPGSGTIRKFQRPGGINNGISSNQQGNAPAALKAAIEHNATGATPKKPSLINERYHDLLDMPDGVTLPEALDGCDPTMLDSILHEMLDQKTSLGWEDIAGQEFAKKNVFEMVIWPMLNPDVFTGLRDSLKGMLQFGPPGTGKTLIGRAIASQSSATFFSISASSLTSKWHGDGEKLVRTLFTLARYQEPSVIFIDEVDSLLSQRQTAEFEANRRLKTEILIQLDGTFSQNLVLTRKGDTRKPRVLLVGATNRPQELDEAARRRQSKKLYIPLPNCNGRVQLISNLQKTEKHSLTPEQLQDIGLRTQGYSGADLKTLCTEAAFEPVRNVSDVLTLTKANMSPICYQDFIKALALARPSVDTKDLKVLEDWNKSYGSFAIQPTD